jgi:predicted LPLAT superfamily acyltransferase
MAQKWTGKSLGSSFFQNLLCFFIKYGGRKIAYFIVYFVAAFYTFLPGVRKNASYYLKRRFPGRAKIKRLFDTYKLNLNFGKILTDRAVLGITGKVKIISSAQDQQLCRELHAKGKGLIIITAHCGCWQMAMSSFDFMEGDKYVIYRRNKEDVDKHAHELSGEKPPVNFIDPAGFGGGSVEIISALSKNGIVCMMGDRTFGSEENKIEVDFLGGKTEIPYSVYRIAGALGTPVAVIFFPHGKAGEVDSAVAKTFFAEDKGQGAAGYAEYAGSFMSALEDFCAKYPYQFFNYYDMWK